MSDKYTAADPIGHQDAMSDAEKWLATIAHDIAPARAGLARTALFSLFRLSAAEREAVFRTFGTRADPTQYPHEKAEREQGEQPPSRS